MKARMVIEIDVSKSNCLSNNGVYCQFYDRQENYCVLFGEELSVESGYSRIGYRPIRCQACLDTFKEDEK